MDFILNPPHASPTKPRIATRRPQRGERDYVEWFEMTGLSLETTENIDRCLRMAASTAGRQMHLWMTLLRYYLRQGKDEAVSHG